MNNLRVNWSSRPIGFERRIPTCLANLHLSMVVHIALSLYFLDLSLWFWNEVIYTEPPPGARWYGI